MNPNKIYKGVVIGNYKCLYDYITANIISYEIGCVEHRDCYWMILE